MAKMKMNKITRQSLYSYSGLAISKTQCVCVCMSVSVKSSVALSLSRENCNCNCNMENTTILSNGARSVNWSRGNKTANRPWRAKWKYRYRDEMHQLTASTTEQTLLPFYRDYSSGYSFIAMDWNGKLVN